MSRMPSSPSPYANPNTPIASSKRPKIQPKLTPSVKSPDHSSLKVDTNLSSYNRPGNRLKDPATPSKNMFSPMLRTTGTSAASAVTTLDSPIYEENNEETDESYNHGYDDSRLVYNSNYSDNEDREYLDDSDLEYPKPLDYQEDSDVFNPYLFISQLPPHEKVMIKDKICLPKKKPEHMNKPTLVLDLDETLVHCTLDQIPNPDLTFPVEFNKILYQIFVRKRPYLEYFLTEVSKHYEVVLFTASQKVYADVLLNKIDPDNNCISYRLFRESCLYVEGNYLKDLSVLDRDLATTILVDNSPHAYGYHINNGIPIESWYDDSNDNELLKLLDYLLSLLHTSDFRTNIRNKFKTYKLVDRARRGKYVPFTAPPF